MTGEVTLRGKVLPIGGLKEKLMAAYRAGITEVLIPEENEKDLEEVAPVVKEQLRITPVRDVKQVLDGADRSPARRACRSAAPRIPQRIPSAYHDASRLTGNETNVRMLKREKEDGNQNR